MSCAAIENTDVCIQHTTRMLSSHRFHTNPTRSQRWSVWMLVVALLAVGPLSGWSTLIGPFGAEHSGGACPHHSSNHNSGPHVCPHHAAMQAAHADKHDADKPAPPEGTTFCPTHAKTTHHDHHDGAHQHTTRDDEAGPQVRCTCDHDDDATPDAVRILDKFVLTSAEQLQRPLYTYALLAPTSSLQPTIWTSDIFRPPRA